MRIEKSILAILLISLHSLAGLFAGMDPDAGTSAASFLRIDPGARPAGMGGAYTALSDDANAVYFNPAGLARSYSSEVTLMYSSWLAGMNYNYLSFKFPKYSFGSLAAAAYMLNSGDITRTTEDEYGLFESRSGSFTASDRAFAVAYAVNIFAASSAGIAAKYIVQENESERGSAIAFDAGLMFLVPGINLNTGVAVRNIGSGLKIGDEIFSLPLEISAGVEYKPGGCMKAVFDADFPADNSPSFALGAEYDLKKFLRLRCGYRYRYEVSELGFFSGLHTGLGLEWKKYSFDYAWVPLGKLGSTHRLSLNMAFSSSRTAEGGSSVIIDTRPRFKSSDIYFDGKLKGNTLVRIDDVAPGLHHITLKIPPVLVFKHKIIIKEPGQVFNVRFDSLGKIIIKTTPINK